MPGDLVPFAVAAVHLFVVNTLHAAITVGRHSDCAFPAFALDDMSLEYAPRDAAGMLELALSVVVGDGLMLPENLSQLLAEREGFEPSVRKLTRTTI